MNEHDRITLNLNGAPIHFDVTADIHERLVDEMQPNAKVGPMHNFLSRSVAAESKEALAPFLEHPGHVTQIAGQVVQAFTPKLKITVGE